MNIFTFFPRHLLFTVSLFVAFLVVEHYLPPITFSAEAYLPWHAVLEMVSIIMTGIVFSFAWYAQTHPRPLFSTLVACAFLGVTLFDIFHVLSFAGMPLFITPNTPGKAINFWLFARFSALFGMLALLIPPKITIAQGRWILLVCTVVGAAFFSYLGIVMPEVFPSTWTPERGLTPFKHNAEWILIVGYLSVALLLIRYRKEVYAKEWEWLAIAALTMAFAEYVFTLYRAPTDVFNFLGHLFKVVSYLIVYQVIFIRGMKTPYETLRLYHALVEDSADPIYVVSVNEGLRFVQVNQASCHHFQREKEALIGHPVYEFDRQFEPADLPSLLTKLRKGQGVFFESQHLLPNGELIPVEISVNRFILGGEEMLSGYFRDIRPRKALETLRQHEMELYQALFDANNAIKLLIDPYSGKIEDANQAAADFYGYSIEALKQMRIWALNIAPSEIQLKRMAMLAELNEPKVFLFQHRLASGEVRHVEVHSGAAKVHGRVLLFSIIHDVTDRENASLSLSQSAAQQRAILEALTEGILLQDAVGNIVISNHAADELFGCRLTELKEKRTFIPDDRVLYKEEGEVFPPDDYPWLQTLRTGIPAKNVMIGMQITPLEATSPPVMRWLSVNTEALFEQGGTQPVGVVSSFFDTTTHREREQRLNAALKEISKHYLETWAVNQMNDLLMTCLSEQEAYDVVQRAGRRIFTGSGFLALTSEAQPNVLTVFAHWGGNTLSKIPVEACWALRRGQIHESSVNGTQPFCSHLETDTHATALCIPLMVQGHLMGLAHFSLIEALDPDQHAHWLQMATAFTESIKLALSNLRLRESLHNQATHDALTGLFNRRKMEDLLLHALQMCRKDLKPVSIAMLDLDHFKQLNDTYGHEAGDAALKQVAHLIQEAVEEDSFVCRFGGEEILIIFPQKGLQETALFLEGLRYQIAKTPLETSTQTIPPITVSIGLAQAPDNGLVLDKLLQAADRALYQAKEKGRNRLEYAEII